MKRSVLMLLALLVTTITSLIAQPDSSAPQPVSRDSADVISIYSGEFGIFEGANFDPFWGQSTNATEITIDGDAVLRYENFNYQGIELGTSVDVSGMDFVHVDMWTENASAVNLFLISPGPSEVPKALEIVEGEWVGYDIPVSHYSNVVDLTELFQFKIDDSGAGDSPTIYLSNLYFFKGDPQASSNADLAYLRVNGATLADFSPSKLNYTVALAPGTTEVPDVTAKAEDDSVSSVTVTNAPSLPGTTTVEVVAQDESTTQTYSVEFTFLTSGTDATLGSLTMDGNSVSGFSPNKFNYEYVVDADVTEAPEVAADPNQSGATVTVRQASEIPDHAIIKVVSEDESKTLYYTVFFKSENLLWSDEFTNPKVNMDHWTYETGNGTSGWGNQELQSYSKDNVFIEDIPGDEGNKAMVIIAESNGGGSFASGRVKTEEKVDIKYGKIEVRIKVPDLETGLWPAAWMLGSNYGEVGWPQSGEIDLMEMGHKEAFRNQQDHTNITENQMTGANVFWYSEAACAPGNETCAASIAGDANFNKPYVSDTEMTDRFQIYRLYWTNREIRFTVEDEGVEYDLYQGAFGITSRELQGIFTKHFYFILNMAVGGNFTDASSAGQVTAPLPAKMYIDYVRVHKYNGLGEVKIGGISTSNQELVSDEVPNGIKLHQNYPNPFNPTTYIRYELPVQSHVTLEVYNLMGKKVSTLVDEVKKSGSYSAGFDAKGLASGIYLYRLTAGENVITRKMVFIK